MAEVGHNLPPDMSVTVGEVTQSLSDWMADNPVVETEEAAREAKVQIDRGKLAIKDMEDERNLLVRPLNEQIKGINDKYRAPRSLLQGVLDEIQSRISAYLRKEERRRMEEAEQARRAAEEAEKAAREAEIRERNAISGAEAGELDIDIAAHISEADQAFAKFQKAEHQAQIAERDTKVKIGGGFTRAVSLREKETLVITDLLRAVNAMLDNEGIREAVIKAARAYRRAHGTLPPGISIETERRI